MARSHLVTKKSRQQPVRYQNVFVWRRSKINSVFTRSEVTRGQYDIIFLALISLGTHQLQ